MVEKKASLLKKDDTRAPFDPRFDTRRDPRFKKMAVKDTKITIDDRFNVLFDKSKNKSEPSVDPYGKKKKKTGEKHIDDLYENEQGKSAYDEHGEFAWDAESSSDFSELTEDEFASENAAWDRNSDNVETGEETSRRLALMGLDWENVTAVDILVLLESFLSTGGRRATLASLKVSGDIESVKVYLSDFGAERMKHEEVSGPSINLPKFEVHRQDIEFSDDEEEDTTSDEDASEEEDSSNESSEGSDEDSSSGEEFVVKKASDSVGKALPVRPSTVTKTSSTDAPSTDDESDEESSSSSGSGDDDLLKANRRAKKLRQMLQEKMEKDKEAEATAAEAMRTYQRERSRYYFAIVTCKEEATAIKLYDMLDGLDADFALDGVDIRFVPDSVSPPREPSSEATRVPSSYSPPETFQSALRHAKVECTWDETPALRTRMLKRKFNRNELAELDLKAYLASDSEESEGDFIDEDDEKITGENLSKYKSALMGGNVDDARHLTQKLIAKNQKLKKDNVKRSRAALGLEDMLENNSDSDSSGSEIDMEIKVNRNLDDLAEKIKERARSAGDGQWNLVEEEDKRTPWEKYLDKKKEQKKAYKDSVKQKIQESKRNARDDDDDDGIDSGDDLLADEKRRQNQKEAKNQRKAARSKLLSSIGDEDDKMDKNNKAQLELMFGDEHETDRHFDMRPVKNVMFAEDGSKLSWKERIKVQKRLAKEKKSAAELETLNRKLGIKTPVVIANTSSQSKNVDEPIPDVTTLSADPRFAAVFESPEFALDPTNPVYKPSDANKKMLEKRREVGMANKRKKLL